MIRVPGIIGVMASISPRFVVGARGRKEGVLLRLAEYRRLLRRIEDLEDALALDRAEETLKELLPYSVVRKRLKRIGKL
jgi:hypothetical protein